MTTTLPSATERLHRLSTASDAAQAEYNQCAARIAELQGQAEGHLNLGEIEAFDTLTAQIVTLSGEQAGRKARIDAIERQRRQASHEQQREQWERSLAEHEYKRDECRDQVTRHIANMHSIVAALFDEMAKGEQTELEYVRHGNEARRLKSALNADPNSGDMTSYVEFRGNRQMKDFLSGSGLAQFKRDAKIFGTA